MYLLDSFVKNIVDLIACYFLFLNLVLKSLLKWNVSDLKFIFFLSIRGPPFCGSKNNSQKCVERREFQDGLLHRTHVAAIKV